MKISEVIYKLAEQLRVVGDIEVKIGLVDLNGESHNYYVEKVFVSSNLMLKTKEVLICDNDTFIQRND